MKRSMLGLFVAFLVFPALDLAAADDTGTPAPAPAAPPPAYAPAPPPPVAPPAPNPAYDTSATTYARPATYGYATPAYAPPAYYSAGGCGGCSPCASPCARPCATPCASPCATPCAEPCTYQASYSDCSCRCRGGLFGHGGFLGTGLFR